MENGALQNQAVSGSGPGNGSLSGPVVFDTASGFPVEEQKEILDEINSLGVEKGLVPKTDLSIKKEAKKLGVLFPLLVNLVAAVLLAGGFIFLWFYHYQDDLHIRRGTAALGVTERKMIQEIRQETSILLGEKEGEINRIRSLLDESGDEYRTLLLSIETLTDEQKQKIEYLLQIQNEYQTALVILQDERTQILEDSRRRESLLRAQAENRSMELSSTAQELARLSNEQEKLTTAEAQLGGFYTMIGLLANEGNFSEASNILSNTVEFLDSPVFYTSRQAESKRMMHMTTVIAMKNVLEKTAAIKDLQAASLNYQPVSQIVQDEDQLTETAPDYSFMVEAAVSPLNEKIASLEQAVRDQAGIINALSSQDEGQTRLIGEYTNRINNLETQNDNYLNQIANLQSWISGQQQTLYERESTISGLRAENAEQSRQMAAMGSEIISLNNTSADLARNNSSLITQIGQLTRSNDNLTLQINEHIRNINTLTRQNSELSVNINNLTRQNNELTSNAAGLTRQNNELTTNVNNLTRQNNELSTNISNLTRQNSELTANVNNLTRQNNDLTTSVNNLTRQNSELTTNVNNLTRQNNELNTNISNLTRQNSELTANINTLTQQNNELTTNVNNLTRQNSELTTNVNNLTRQNSDSTASVNNLTRQNNELIANVNTLTRQNNELSGNVNDLLRQNEEMTTTYNEQVRLNSELQQRVNELTRQLDEIRRAAQSLLNP